MRLWNLTWAIPATLGILVLWAFSAIANYDFGLTQGTNEPRDLYFFTITSAQASGMASLAVDLLKAVLPAMIVVAWVFRAWIYALGGAVCFLLCLGFSAQNSVGFALSSHARATDERGQAVDQWSALRKTMETTQTARDMVPVHRPSAVVDAELAAKKVDARFTESASCANDARGTINFCRDYRGLSAEKAAADSAIALDKRLDELRSQLDTRKRVSDADPMSGSAAALLGWKKEGIAGGRSLWLAVLVETLSAIGLALIWGVFFAAWTKKPAEARAAPKSVADPDAGLVIVPPAPAPALRVEDPVPALPDVSGWREHLKRKPADAVEPVCQDSLHTEAADAAPIAAAPAIGPHLAYSADDAPRALTKGEKRAVKKNPFPAPADEEERQTVELWAAECLTSRPDRKNPPSSGDCHASLLAYCERECVAPVDQVRMTQIMTEILKPQKVRGRYPRNAKERIWPGWNLTMPAAGRLRASA